MAVVLFVRLITKPPLPEMTPEKLVLVLLALAIVKVLPGPKLTISLVVPPPANDAMLLLKVPKTKVVGEAELARTTALFGEKLLAAPAANSLFAWIVVVP